MLISYYCLYLNNFTSYSALLFFIVKQLVNIQAVFNQNLVNQMGGSESHGRLSLNKLNNAATTLDKALDKYKTDE